MGRSTEVSSNTIKKFLISYHKDQQTERQGLVIEHWSCMLQNRPSMQWKLSTFESQNHVCDSRYDRQVCKFPTLLQFEGHWSFGNGSTASLLTLQLPVM